MVGPSKRDNPRPSYPVTQQLPEQTPLGLEELLYQNGFEKYDPTFHSFKLGLPGYGVVRIGGQPYVYNVRNVPPDFLKNIGVQQGDTTANYNMLAHINPANLKDLNAEVQAKFGNPVNPLTANVAGLMNLFGK